MFLLLFCNRCIFIQGACCLSEILMACKKHYIHWCAVFFYHIQIFHRIIHIDTAVSAYCCGNAHTQHGIKDTEFNFSVFYRVLMHMNVDKTRSHYPVSLRFFFCYSHYLSVFQYQV